MMTVLRDLEVKNFLAKAEAGKKLAAGNGLHLFKSPAGTGIWRVKYHIQGKERLYSIGSYPEIGLAAARVETTRIKALANQGKDPVSERRLERAANAVACADTFSAVTEKWLALKSKEWSKVHAEKASRALERDILPRLGNLPISRITRPMVASAIEQISGRGVHETASRILQHVNRIFCYAQAIGLCEDNPASTAREVLPRKKEQKLMPALLDLPRLGNLLRKAQVSGAAPAVKLAHRLAAYTAARISNVVEAEFKELDLDGDQPMWIIPRVKLKKKDPRFPALRIPLAPSIAAELRTWRSLIGDKGHVFPSTSKTRKYISREAIEKFYRETLGLRDTHTPHGWRASMTSAAKDAGHRKDVVDLATDHTHDTDTAIRYDRGERFEQRIALFNWWGAQLDAAERGASIHQLAVPQSSAA